MLKNHLKIGLRNFLKYKVFSFINVFGLAAAMSICMLVMLMWVDQKSYDNFHENADRIYRVVTSPLENNRMRATIPYPSLSALKSESEHVEEVVILRRGFGGDATFTNEQNERSYSEMIGYFSNSSFLNVFNFNLEKGDKRTALLEPNSLVISQEVAEKLFGKTNPIGKTINFSDRSLNYWTDEATAPKDWGIFTISGVFENQPKSHLKFDVIASEATLDLLYKESRLEDLTNNWSTDHQSYGYVLLKLSSNEKDLQSALNSLTNTHLARSENDYLKNLRFNYQALSDITPGAATGNSTDTTLPLFAYYILGGLALIILLASCLNYTSLSVARAITRSNEIGVRKVNGASKIDLIYQFISEAFITVSLALFVANGFLLMLKKAFLNLWLNQYLNFDLNFNVRVYSFFLIFTLIVGFLAGVYPAIRMSKFNPIRALKRLERAGAGKFGLRKVLTVSQFAISLFFIISSILVYNQLEKFTQFDYGFNPRNVININLQSNDYQLIKRIFSEIPEVDGVSATAYIPADGRNDNTNIKKIGVEDDGKTAVDLSVDRNYAEVMEIDLVAGEKIPDGSDSISSFVMVNEMATRELGFIHPSEIVGQTFLIGGQNKTVSGVFKDINFFMLFTGRQTGPIVFQYKPEIYKYATVRTAGMDKKEAISKLTAAWQKIDPVHPLLFEHYDEQLADNNQAIMDLVSIIGFMAFIAILVSCLGLYGMATYSTERRTKEIGVRKVLGASTLALNFVLSKEFLKMIGIAILIAAPVSYFVNNLWLNYMITRAEFGLSTIALGTSIVISLAMLTVIPQSFRIANKNPVETLKVE